MEADETGEETDVGAVVNDLWRILLDYDKSGKDALKAKNQGAQKAAKA